MKKFCAFVVIQPNGDRSYKAGLLKNIHKNLWGASVDVLSVHDTLRDARDGRDNAVRERYAPTRGQGITSVDYTLKANRLAVLDRADDALFVVNWCRRVDASLADDEPPAHISAETVRLAHEQIPPDYETALAEGWLAGDYRIVFQKHDFSHCRRFLQYAARKELDLAGSRR